MALFGGPQRVSMRRTRHFHRVNWFRFWAYFVPACTIPFHFLSLSLSEIVVG